MGLHLLLLTWQTRAQSLDYSQVFGHRYHEAMRFLVEQIWMVDTISSHGQDPAFVLAIVFPELIRYAALRDRIETLALSALYLQYGSEYADFSVGRFQMKPSFAEKLESDCPYLSLAAGSKNNRNDSDIRKKRLQRLQSPKEQLRYLLCFCQVLDRLYPLSWTNQEEKLRFYATAYHYGYKAGAAEIDRASETAWYHTAVLQPQARYVYADISLFFYHRMKKRND